MTQSQAQALQALLAQTSFRCFHDYRHTERAAAKLGIPTHEVAEIKGFGGMCDCEFAMNGAYYTNSFEEARELFKNILSRPGT